MKKIDKNLKVLLRPSRNLFEKKVNGVSTLR